MVTPCECGNVVDISKIHAASILVVEVCRVAKFVCLFFVCCAQFFFSLEKPWGRGVLTRHLDGDCLGTPIASSLLVLSVVALKMDGAVLAHLSQSADPPTLPLCGFSKHESTCTETRPAHYCPYPHNVTTQELN